MRIVYGPFHEQASVAAENALRARLRAIAEENRVSSCVHPSVHMASWRFEARIDLRTAVGLPVMLLIDQTSEPGSGARPIWSPCADTITLVIHGMLAEHPGVMDEIWLRDTGENYLALIERS
jgi:hypothetical protein